MKRNAETTVKSVKRVQYKGRTSKFCTSKLVTFFGKLQRAAVTMFALTACY